MNIYIIYAYPNQNGLCSAALESLQAGFTAAGHQVVVSDLYAENFNPVLLFNQDKKRRNIQFDPETEIYRNHIQWAHHLVFVYPIWWSGMPAILKGFIDRVFATGFVYHFNGLLPVGHLKGKTAWIVNTHDSPRLFALFFQQDYGRVLKKQILQLMCGIRKVKHITLPFVKGKSIEQRQKWLAYLYKKASRF